MSALSQISLASSDRTHSNSAEPASPPLPYIMLHMNGSRKFCQRGSNFDNFFFIFLYDPNTTKSGPPLARQRNTI